MIRHFIDSLGSGRAGELQNRVRGAFSNWREQTEGLNVLYMSWNLEVGGPWKCS